jgi:hypothetical protein
MDAYRYLGKVGIFTCRRAGYRRILGLGSMAVSKLPESGTDPVGPLVLYFRRYGPLFLAHVPSIPKLLLHYSVPGSEDIHMRIGRS